MTVSKQTKKYLFISIGIFLLLSLIFVKIAYELHGVGLNYFDHTIIDYVLLFVSPKLTTVMIFFTNLGSSHGILLCLFIAVVLMIWYKKSWEAIFLMIGTAGGTVFNQLLKVVFQRERPSLHRLIEIKGYSFPSGHSMVSIIFFGMIGIFLMMFLKSNATKALVFILTVCTILMIGLSRIYLGVHYPSDVLAGFAAGGAWLTICLIALKVVKEIGERDEF